MALTKDNKKELIEKFKLHEADTGSCQVQIALLTTRINQLVDHFKTHKKDNHSRRGLLKLVGQRRRMLDYLHKTEEKEYQRMIKELGLRR